MVSNFTCPYCRNIIDAGIGRPNFCAACGGNLTKPPRGAGLNLRHVAVRQKQLLWCILIQLLLYLGLVGAANNLPPPIGNFAAVGGAVAVITTQILALVCTVGMLKAAGYGVGARILYIVLLLAPCVSLVALLSANGVATRTLQNAGPRVGFMGVKKEELERFLNITGCRQCGYSLIGNVSGVCPECGTAITAVVAAGPPKSIG